MTDLENINFLEVAEESEIPLNERLFLDVGDIPIVIINLAGKLFAIGDVCTHDGGPAGDGDIDGYEIICPRHGARFDIRNGNATKAPAFTDIPTYPVKVENGKVYLGLKRPLD